MDSKRHGTKKDAEDSDGDVESRTSRRHKDGNELPVDQATSGGNISRQQVVAICRANMDDTGKPITPFEVYIYYIYMMLTTYGYADLVTTKFIEGVAEVFWKWVLTDHDKQIYIDVAAVLNHKRDDEEGTKECGRRKRKRKGVEERETKKRRK